MEVSIDEPLNVDWDGNELLLSDILGTDDDVISQRLENEVEIKLLGKAISKLSPRSRRLSNCGSGLEDRREGKNTERSGGPSGNFTVLYFQVGKKDHEEIEEGNCEV